MGSPLSNRPSLSELNVTLEFIMSLRADFNVGL